MSSLKAELMGEHLPEFTLVLPNGWERRAPSDEVRDEMLAAAKRRLMQAHRPDLYGQTTALINKLFAEMRRVETVAFFGPAATAPDEAFLPATLTASLQRGQDGEALDHAIAQLIRSEGATPLGDDKRFLRWEQDAVENVDGTRVATTTVVYFTPVPGTGRTRALRFTLVLTHDPAQEGDEEFTTGLKRVFDAHLSTFAWVTS
ncbi:hypothetical protein [Homoserinimonas hongtaonis]|uniref:Uncharacterized protein n=1 Tax=Homoserinimonas hongtaonis TaxID=2079791 RepID=A0A2U1T0T0_9MICO|nr:hypothetical protein [Salinibacterium hongtaonis]AWB90018.1 hypothetical protein C2138_11115 [Salinibacterium hongtaonis]PWB97481.1 hypothetical protein DF220_06285 [Salinibacterium hongtaonis]